MLACAVNSHSFVIFRFWLQNWAGPSLSGSSLVMHWLGLKFLVDLLSDFPSPLCRSTPKFVLVISFDFDSDDKVDSVDGSSLEPTGTRSQHGYRSSSNSNSSSYGSISSSSSDSDRRALGAGDLEADADSLMSRQSGLSSLGQMQNDGIQLVRLLYLRNWKMQESLFSLFYSFVFFSFVLSCTFYFVWDSLSVLLVLF